MERIGFEQWKSKEVARLLALVEAERRYYQEILAALPAPIVLLAADLGVVYANRAFLQRFGLKPDDLRRKTITQIIESPNLPQRIEAANAEGRPHAPEPFQHRAQTLKISIVPIRNWDDETEMETLLMLDDESNPAVPAPVVAPPPAPVILDQLPAVIWTADAETLAFESVAGSVEQLLGYPPEHWVGTAGFFERRIHSDDRAATMAFYRSVVEAGGQATAEYRALTRGGQTIWCRESLHAPLRETPPGTSRKITGITTDITRRKELELQMLTAGRMEALQGLAGRLAHDLNNPIMIAGGYGEEVLGALPGGSPVRNDVSELLNATKRIARVADQLSEFTRRQGTPPVRLDLGPQIADMESDLLRAACTEVQLRPSEERVWAWANADLLPQVLLAFAAGAGEGAWGRTGVTVAWTTDTLRERTSGAALPPGKYARITLRDDGVGLDEASQAALFETVLAEKDPASPGSAIARAYALVRYWGGDVALSSVSPHGTEIAIYLRSAEADSPLSPEPLGQEPVASKPAARPEREILRETVLVVDDEAGIRSLVRKILRRERYQVLEAGTAEEALAIAVSYSGPIHLLVTDVMLPGLNGVELARRLYEGSPSLRVLYISGYTEDESVRAGEYPPGARFLPKPFTLSALVNSVRLTLDA